MFGLGKRRKAEGFDSWREAPLFRNLTEEQLDLVSRVIRERKLSEGDVLVREGDPATDLFLVRTGSLEVLKAEKRREREHRIATVLPGEVVGELALFDELPRSATVRALEESSVWQLQFQQIRPGADRETVDLDDPEARQMRIAYRKLVLNMAGVMSARLREKADESLATAQRRTAMGQFMVHVLTLLCAYTVLLGALPTLRDKLPSSSSYVSIPLQLAFGWGSLKFIRNTGYPLHVFGLGLRNMVGSLVEAAVLTVPFLVLLTGVKWIVLQTDPAWSELPLIEHTDVLARFGDATIRTYATIYALTCVVQELIVRSALQSSLELFLTGPRRVLQAIAVSALLFSVNHLHMGFLFAAMAFLPGVFWGWLFHRRKHIVGPVLSHTVVGSYVFFVMGAALP